MRSKGKQGYNRLRTSGFCQSTCVYFLRSELDKDKYKAKYNVKYKDKYNVKYKDKDTNKVLAT